VFIKCKEKSRDDLYKILIGSIVPRPIAWVSTINSGGLTNLAPFSFFNCFGADPPMVGFAPGFKRIIEDENGITKIPKDTLRNVQEIGEFVVNIVSRDVAEKMNKTSAEFDAKTSEFDAVGLTAVKSELVMPPRVKESMINFECKLIQVVQYGNNNLVLGEILAMHLNDQVISKSGHIEPAVLKAVGRMAGSLYCTTDDRFEMARPF
jgi:flavin reductase (DIM6/NTAB) family NADH-FMN oxidoreductase RutF